VSRRSLREAERASADAARSGVVRRAPVATPAVPAPVAAPKNRRRVRAGFVNLAVMAIAGGILATVAIPAYAMNPSTVSQASFGTSTIDHIKKTGSQSVSVADSVQAPLASVDSYTATTQQQLDAQKAAAVAAAAETAQMQAYSAAYTGPTAAQYLANPAYPNFSLAKVFQVAQQYIGVPYVYGGATPAGFDCSGFVMFVYAQFGVSLPHSVSGIDAAGTTIAPSAAQPGDLIVFNDDSHVGFVAGGGNILDAPDTGRSISIRPLWTDAVHYVRIGI
jgi:cell wall-associated NlpC family hydrolase